MVKARFIRAISTHAQEGAVGASPTAEAIIVVAKEEGPIAVNDMIDIDEFGRAKVDAVWPAGDPRITYPDLAYEAIEGELVVLVFKPYPDAPEQSD